MTDYRPLTSGAYSMLFEDLDARVWDLGSEQTDGTRVYLSAGDAALKWLIQGPTGTPAESGKTLTDNHSLRKQFIAAMVDDGWADRVGERRYVLQVPPPNGGTAEDPEAARPVPLEDPDDHGTPVDEVPSDAVAGPAGDLTVCVPIGDPPTSLDHHPLTGWWFGDQRDQHHQQERDEEDHHDEEDERMMYGAA